MFKNLEFLYIKCRNSFLFFLKKMPAEKDLFKYLKTCKQNLF